MPHYIKNINFINTKIEENLEKILKEYDYLWIPVLQKKSDKEKSNTEKKLIATRILELLDEKLKILSLMEKENFYGDKENYFILYGSDITTILFAGFGEWNSEKDLVKTSNIVQSSLQSINRKKIKKIAIHLESFFDSKVNSKASLKNLLTNVAIGFADYSYHSLEAKEITKEIENLDILYRENIDEEILNFTKAILNARSSTMDLVNMPANKKTTNTLVEKAKSLEKMGLKIEIIDDVEWIKKNMPCFFTVSRGSLATDPPKWIKVKYTPQTEILFKIGLIGKSIIFDTGGYQVKPDNYMNTMKADMTGGASVLSIIEEIARLHLPYIEITSYCPVTPNKIDSDAMLPDSIVDTTCGKKVEIRHTDAEGRLTLIDAVSLAERDGNDLLFTIATLTGAAARAVGPRIALMSTRKDWRIKFENACDEIGESYQSLEIVQDDYEDIKSKLDGADIKNLGNEKYRGAQTAATFVFSGLSDLETPILHMDIAGGDMTKEEKATGIAIKGILNFIYEISKNKDFRT